MVVGAEEMEMSSSRSRGAMAVVWGCVVFRGACVCLEMELVLVVGSRCLESLVSAGAKRWKTRRARFTSASGVNN
jgi:hypothetical protein